MIIPIKQIITEAKEFNVGPSLGQNFLGKVHDHIQNEKLKIKDKLLELKLRERSIGASTRNQPTTTSTPQTPQTTTINKIEVSKDKPIFNSSKINIRQKTPYDKYISVYA